MKLYNIEDVAMMTDLSTRTIRSYLADGFLVGDKSSGAWQFTPEQLDSFFKNDVVQPAIRAKRNAIVYDFLGSKPQDKGTMCVVLDLPLREELSVMKYFCEYISGCEPTAKLRFAADRLGKGVRVILSGNDKDVMGLLTSYYNR